MRHATCGGLLRGASLMDPVGKIIATHGCSGKSVCDNKGPILMMRRVAPIGLVVGMSRDCFARIGGNTPMSMGLSMCNSRVFGNAVGLVCPAVSTTAHAFPVRVGLSGESRHIHPKVFTHTALGFNATSGIIIPSLTVIGRTNSNSHCICICGSNGMSCGGMRLNEHVKARCRLGSNIPGGSRMIITNRTHLTGNIRMRMRGWCLVALARCGV